MGILLALLMIAMYIAGLLITPVPPGDQAAKPVRGTK